MCACVLCAARYLCAAAAAEPFCARYTECLEWGERIEGDDKIRRATTGGCVLTARSEDCVERETYHPEFSGRFGGMVECVCMCVPRG